MNFTSSKTTNAKNGFKKNSNIVLRPRFQLELSRNKQSLIEAFENAINTQSDFIVKLVDDHVFVKLPQSKQHFWSPQLHLEISEINPNNSKIYGLFGPNPNVWLFFMFLHFAIATLFLGFSIWTYTNWSLGKDFFMQALGTGLMMFFWVILYTLGRLGRASTRDEMHELNDFMKNVIKM